MKIRVAGTMLGLALLMGGLTSCQSIDSQNNSTSLPTSDRVDINDELIATNSVEMLEETILQRVNQYRQSRGLSPLKQNAIISRYAKIHSEQMASKTVTFSHDGFEGRVQAIGKALAYQRAAENIAYNQGYSDPANVTVEGWIKSSGHRQNMEGDFDLTGIGVAKNASGEYYFTQIFIKQLSASTSAKIQNKSTLEAADSPFDSAFLITIEQEVHRQINQYRLSRNLAPLRLDSRVSYEARLYSQQMARGKAPFSHKGMEKRFAKVAQIVPYRKAAENLAVNQGYVDPATTAVDGWIKSSGHRQNIEGNFNVTGIGVAKNVNGEYYLTQFFILER